MQSGEGNRGRLAVTSGKKFAFIDIEIHISEGMNPDFAHRVRFTEIARAKDDTTELVLVLTPHQAPVLSCG